MTRYLQLLVPIMFSVSGSGAEAQQRAAAPSASEQPIDGSTATRLVWWSMAAVDQANVTGNYSVLRDIGVPSFQASNSAASLATTFQTFRTQSLDLGILLNVVPTFQLQPVVKDGVLRLRGFFPVRPISYGFDLLFQNVNGRWALLAISVAPLPQGETRGVSKGR